MFIKTKHLSSFISKTLLLESLSFSTIVMLLSLLTPSVYAVTSSTPPINFDKYDQEFLRQKEREENLRRQQEQTPDVMSLQEPSIAPELDRLPTRESPCFTINNILLVGDSAEKFSWALAAAHKAKGGKKDLAVWRCLGSKSINLVMRRIQNGIVKRGYVTTRVLAAPQDLTKGTLKLTLVPGRINNIKFASEADAYAVSKWNAVPTSPGDLLNLRDIEQALENFKRVPTAEADIQIAPATPNDPKTKVQPGESDLILHWKQAFPLRLSLSADDSGSKSTGKYQGNATISYDNLWTLNDLFYFSFGHDMGGSDPGQRGTKGYTAHYSVPFGYWLLSFTGSNTNFHQEIGKHPVNYEGESKNREIKLSRLVYRDAVRKTILMLSGWERSSKNFTDKTENEIARKRMAGWEFGINHREFIGPSILDATLSYKKGTGAMGSLPVPEEVYGTGTSRPEIILANLQYNLPLEVGKQRLRYGGTLRAQWNRTPLITQDQFSIGGRYTVRGYDLESSPTAEHGWFIRNDLGVALGHTKQELYIGFDYGEMGGPSSKERAATYLSGAVMGLRGGYKWLTYDLFYSKPVSKPSDFKAASYVTGFSLNFSI